MRVEDLIPTFQVGDKVLIYFYDTEYRCPDCGKGIFPARSIGHPPVIATIMPRKRDIFRHLPCGRESPIPEGWWYLQGLDGAIGYAPYTVLEKIEE